MRLFLTSLSARLRRVGSLRVSLPVPRPVRVMAGLSVLGLAGLTFMAGAAVMTFRLPSADFFDKAFSGAKAWNERGRADESLCQPAGAMAREGVSVDRPDQTCDGFTLVTTARGPRARLIDMRGNVVHQWEMPFSQAWPHAPHIRDPLPDDQVHWFRCHLYPNGDLLAVYHAEGDTPFGYGLVKLDQDSKLLWAYAGHAHHDIDVDEDGTIYTLGQELVRSPPAGLEALPGPYMADSVVVLSPEGRQREAVPILEAFRDSPYAGLLLASLDARADPGRPHLDEKGDVVHANSVKVLPRALAAKFPLFESGQVLVSLRSSSTVAVLDLRQRAVTWAARGAWQSQHDAEFLDNGHLLLYDNAGSSRGSRVLEYDPLTQAVPWEYANDDSAPFHAGSRGMKQRLPNGNTLLIDPDHWSVVEVTRDKKLVWEASCGGVVTGARRYRPDELTFLIGGMRARP